MRTEATHHTPDTMPQRSGNGSKHDAEKENISLTEQVRRKLMLSLDELLRMEDEGGSGITATQTAEIKKLSEEIHRIDALLFPEKPDSGPTSTSHNPEKEKHDE